MKKEYKLTAVNHDGSEIVTIWDKDTYDELVQYALGMDFDAVYNHFSECVQWLNGDSIDLFVTKNDIDDVSPVVQFILEEDGVVRHVPSDSTIKCISCEVEIENEDYAMSSERGETEGQPVCESCFHESTPFASAGRNREESYHVTEFYNSAAYEDASISEYFESIKWISSDAWRGYYEGKTPKGYTQMVDGWFGAVDGHFPNDSIERFHEIWESGILEGMGIDLFMSSLTTSNLFSNGIEVYVSNDHIDLFKSIMAGDTHSA
jgi:hypothetical protein